MFNKLKYTLLAAIILMGLFVQTIYSKTFFLQDGWSVLFFSVNIVLFFFITKKLFSNLFTGLFLVFVFSVLPWYLDLTPSVNKIIPLIVTNMVFLIMYWNGKRQNFQKKFLCIIPAILFLSVWTTHISHYENLPYPPKQQEIDKINLYRGYLDPINPAFSRLYSNKAISLLNNLETNFFEAVDLNYYFFANHPLERVGIEEKEKIYSSLLPLFVIGLLFLKFRLHSFVLIWSASFLFLSGLFGNRYFDLNTALITPFLLTIGLGLEKISQIKKPLRVIIIFCFSILFIVELLVFGSRLFYLK